MLAFAVRSVWQSHVVFTISPTWSRFAATIHALDGRWVKRRTFFEELGDRSGAAWSINQQGDIAARTGDMAAARGFYQRALSAFREAGDPWGSARSLTDLGYIDCEQGDHLAARAAFREAMEIFAGWGIGVVWRGHWKVTRVWLWQKDTPHGR